MRYLIATAAAIGLLAAGSGVAFANTDNPGAYHDRCSAPISVNVVTCSNILDDILGHDTWND